MNVLGIRCSNTDFVYCVLTGTSGQPIVNRTKRVAFPNGYTEPEVLRWLHQEAEAILQGGAIDVVVIKRAEVTVRRSNNLEQRIAAESVITLAAAQCGCSVEKKVNPTIAKDLGLKGKAKYLQSQLDTSPIPNFDAYSDKERDAILAAWSCTE